MLSTVLWIVVGITAVLTLLPLLFGLFYRRQAGMTSSQAKMDGKTVVITGASAGIGKEAARDLARRGARVIMGCRNLEKSSKVIEDIQSSTGNKDVFVKKLDTSSLTSVRSFAKEILAEENKIDVLILNAGIGGMENLCLTPDGFELTMATNHFGHFLLGNLLLGRMKESSPSRIVVTSSRAHRFIEKMTTENLHFQKGGFGPLLSYGRSKLCNILFVRQLAEITEGTGVVVNALCPGIVSTEIFQKSGGIVIGTFYRLLAPFIGKTEVQGAQTIVHLAVADETADITGKFFEECKVSKNDSKLSKDSGLAKKLWEVSESLVKLEPSEKHY